MSAKEVLSDKLRALATRLASHMALAVMLLSLAPAQLAHAWQGPGTAKPAYPRVSLGEGLQLKYVGEVSPDGKFRSRLGMFFESHSPEPAAVQAAPTPEEVKRQQDYELAKQAAVRQEVPPSIELHQQEQPVEDFQPHEHAVDNAKGHSALGTLADSVVSFVYGEKPVLVALQSVTTDSQHRVIITDAGAHAVHVLAHSAKHSFQIIGGPGRRLQSPEGVAVDGEDNIYVSDSKRELILVYDSAGQFVRTIGTYGDEGLFERPSGIAIDGKAGHLYVVDPPRHTLFIFDLKGYLLARVEPREGGFSTRAGSPEPGGFQYPQSVLVHNDELVVLDATRIHILTLQGKFLTEFKVTNSADWRKGQIPGLFVDAEGHICVTDPGSGTIREYSREGQFLGAFGQLGIGMGEFNGLAGMWADSAGRVYIADAHRIQIYQMSDTK
jgi:sugar lactone lactonase YvrE